MPRSFGFANQADDYVQALLFVHDYESTLYWLMPTPTWVEEWTDADKSRWATNPFTPDIAHGDGSTGGSGKGGGGKGKK